MPRQKERQGIDTFTGRIEGTSAIFAVEGNSDKTFEIPVSYLSKWRKAANDPALVDEILRAEAAANPESSL